MEPDRPHPNGWMQRCLPSENRAKPRRRVEPLPRRVQRRRDQARRQRQGRLRRQRVQPAQGLHLPGIRRLRVPLPQHPHQGTAAHQSPKPEETAAGRRRLQVALHRRRPRRLEAATRATRGTGRPKDWILDYDGKSEAEGQEPLDREGVRRLRDDRRLAAARKPSRRRRAGHPAHRRRRQERRRQARRSDEVPDAGDSGIYLRGSEQGPGQHLVLARRLAAKSTATAPTRRCPPEVRAGVTPKVNADKPPGQWNRFVITMKGDRLTVVLNGQTVIDNAAAPRRPRNGPDRPPAPRRPDRVREPVREEARLKYGPDVRRPIG